ncbi:MAG: hypothetical protein KDA05_10175, partial [Phycisphaerales bacterium]|nr:hypothetical protein [Phycisphaerales bacterium]
MPQHHPAFLTSFSTDASAGTATWSSPSNAAGSDGSYATVAFSGAANEQSQYLVCTGPAFRRAFQSGETPTGITVAIEARDAAGDTYTGSAGIVLAEARLVVGGVIQTGAANLAGNDQVGDSSTPERHQIVLGGPDELWGASLAEADIGSGLGVALRFECLDATARTLQVDSVRLVAWGTKAAACVVESAGNA